MTPRAFYHVGGDIIHRARPISETEALGYDALYRKEALLAHQSGDDEGWKRARSLLDELVSARVEKARWARCSGAAR